MSLTHLSAIRLSAAMFSAADHPPTDLRGLSEHWTIFTDAYLTLCYAGSWPQDHPLHVAFEEDRLDFCPPNDRPIPDLIIGQFVGRPVMSPNTFQYQGRTWIMTSMGLSEHLQETPESLRGVWMAEHFQLCDHFVAAPLGDIDINR